MQSADFLRPRLDSPARRRLYLSPSFPSEPDAIQKGRSTNVPLPLRNTLDAVGLVLFDLEDSNALVVATLLANPMGRFERTAVGALAHCGHLQLADSGAASVTSCLGCFSLRYSHCWHLLAIISV